MEFALDLKSRKTEYQPTIQENCKIFSVRIKNSAAKDHKSVYRKAITKYRTINKNEKYLEGEVISCFNMPYKCLNQIF